MYQSFSILSIDKNCIDNTIEIIANFDIDPKSLNEQTVQLYNKSTKGFVNTDFKINGTNITVLIKDEIILNSEYIVNVTGIKTVTGMELSSGLRRSVIFTSSIKEETVIVTPINNEEINNLKVTLKAVLDDKEYFNLENKFYHIQIADDVAFINIIQETKTNNSENVLRIEKSDQYFIRARVETNNDFGKWSQISSFYFINNNNKENDEPIIINDFTLIERPQNGETPESIILKFSDNIDQDCFDKIIVTRSDI